MATLIKLARLTQPDFKGLAASRARAQLLTIPYSHYCELGAWALQAAKVPFDEHAYGPGGNVLPLLRLRVGGGEKLLSSTSQVSKPSNEGDAEVHLQKRPGGSATAVPACCMPDGSVLLDSWSIVEFAGDTANVAAVPDDFKLLLDTRLAPLTRQLTYHILIGTEKNHDVWHSLVASEGGLGWKAAWWAGGKWMTSRMTKMFSADDAAARELCNRRLRELFAQIAEEHGDGIGEAGGPFLFGEETPGMADLALAALVAPTVMPPLFCRGKYAAWFDRLVEQDVELREDIESWRATAAGKHSLRVYEGWREGEGAWRAVW